MYPQGRYPSFSRLCGNRIFLALCLFMPPSSGYHDENPHDPLTGEDENGCDRGAIFIPMSRSQGYEVDMQHDLSVNRIAGLAPAGMLASGAQA